MNGVRSVTRDMLDALIRFASTITERCECNAWADGSRCTLCGMIPLLVVAIRGVSDADFVLTESGRRAEGPDWQLDEAIAVVYAALYDQLREWTVAGMMDDQTTEEDASDDLSAALSNDDAWDFDPFQAPPKRPLICSVCKVEGCTPDRHGLRSYGE